MFASCWLAAVPFESCCSLCSAFFSNLVISRESSSIVCSSPEVSSKVGISARLCALVSSTIFPCTRCMSAETWSDISTQAGGRFIIAIPPALHQHAPPIHATWFAYCITSSTAIQQLLYLALSSLSTISNAMNSPRRNYAREHWLIQFFSILQKLSMQEWIRSMYMPWYSQLRIVKENYWEPDRSGVQMPANSL